MYNYKLKYFDKEFNFKNFTYFSGNREMHNGLATKLKI